jgi:hypothetical protein
VDDEPVFHVTYSRFLGGIARHGLVPGRGRSIGGASYDAHRRGAIFLTSADGIGFWAEKAEQWAEQGSENAYEDGLVPVVLRVNIDPDELCEIDELGTADAKADAYRCETEVEPEYLEVWDGDDWLPIEDYNDVDTRLAFDFEETDDGDELVWFVAESPLIPPDEARE